MHIAFIIVCLLGIALSLKSVIVLGGVAPWTSLGWWLTAVYFVEALVKSTAVPSLPAIAEYAALTILAVSFVIAGVRDERQAEPWWWPNARSITRAEKRRAT